MRWLSHTGIFIALFVVTELSAQKINGEIFIPLSNRSEIWLKPRLDTLDNQTEYEFKIRVSAEYTISQFLFENGLAIQTDSVLKIIPNCTNYGGYDTATLRVIVTSVSGSRIFLFQKQFIVKVPPKMYPVHGNPRYNIMKINDKVTLERNRPYSKTLFDDGKPYISLFDNDVNMKKYDVQNVTIIFYEREGKQYYSQGDTISEDAIKELRKVKNPIPVFIKVEALNGRTKKVVWNKVVVYNE